jgi:hypothetical protein
MDYTGQDLWPSQDEYDYLPCANYEREIEWICKAVSEFAGSYSDIRFALKYKPKERRTRSDMARMADAIAGDPDHSEAMGFAKRGCRQCG